MKHFNRTRIVPVLRTSLLLALVVGIGCAMIGAETAFPGPVQTSGVGPLRPAFTTETNIDGAVAGQALEIERQAIGSSQATASGHLFYAAAPFLDDRPGRQDGLGDGMVDWNQFAARRILRSAPRSDLGFDEGDVVLEAEFAWEQGAVFDPWVVALPDGSVRLYYGTAGGKIGVAEAPSVDGTFTKRPDSIVDGVSPSVVANPNGGWLMFFESPMGIGLATSSDGFNFDVQSEDLGWLLPADDNDETPNEAQLRSPGALVAVTPAGRLVIRVYFEVVFDDGSTRISMAGGDVDWNFDRLEGYVYEGDVEAGTPRPHLTPEGITVLYASVASRNLQRRHLIAGVIPPHHRFAEPPAED